MLIVFVEMVGCVKVKSNFKLRWIKLLLLLIYPNVAITSRAEGFDILAELSVKKRNMLVNILFNKIFANIRHIIMHGSPIIGIPILDPFEMEDVHLEVPVGLFNFDFRVKNISVIGFGSFEVHRNVLHLSNLTFDMEVSLPRIVIAAETIAISEVDNDFTAIPVMYNKGKTELEMDNFRLQANLHLKQSEDERSILIDKIEKVFWDIPTFKINSEVGIVDRENYEILSYIEEVLAQYVQSCKDVIIKIISNAILTFGNPILNRLDTWRYIAVLL